MFQKIPKDTRCESFETWCPLKKSPFAVATRSRIQNIPNPSFYFGRRRPHLGEEKRRARAQAGAGSAVGVQRRELRACRSRNFPYRRSHFQWPRFGKMEKCCQERRDLSPPVSPPICWNAWTLNRESRTCRWAQAQQSQPQSANRAAVPVCDVLIKPDPRRSFLGVLFQLTTWCGALDRASFVPNCVYIFRSKSRRPSRPRARRSRASPRSAARVLAEPNRIPWKILHRQEETRLLRFEKCPTRRGSLNAPQVRSKSRGVSKHSQSEFERLGLIERERAVQLSLSLSLETRGFPVQVPREPGC